jgi:hypothetical protein
VDDIVAVAVELDGSTHHWLTWGRVFGGTEYDKLAVALAPHLGRGDHAPGPEDVVFETLRMASDAPYFYECLVDIMDARMLASSTTRRFENPTAGSRLGARSWLTTAAQRTGTAVPPIPAEPVARVSGGGS